MRDIFLLVVLPFLIYAIFQRPFIGLGLWIWTALFFPNGWVFGIAGSIRYNFLFAGLTIFVYLTTKEKPKLIFGKLGSLVILFYVWSLLTTIFGLSPDEVRWEYWFKFSKIIALFIFILLIVDKKIHIDFILWCLVLSVGFYACLEGLKYIASAGGHNIAGLTGHVIGDRNELALAMAMLLPISFYLLHEFGQKSYVFKFGLLSLIILLVISIVGTSSRGGMVALSTVGGYLFLKSKRKFLFIFLFVAATTAMVGLIPEEWFNRMNTLNQAEGDASFMGRVVAWKLSFILASQNPALGGGFKALETGRVWFTLSQEFAQYPFFYSGNAIPNPNLARAAHSIYFQVLADHGFIGLTIFVAILISSFLRAGAIADKVRATCGPEWLINLSTMLKLSIFGYAIGGAALSFAYFDMIYAIFALIIVLENKFLPAPIMSQEPQPQNYRQF